MPIPAEFIDDAKRFGYGEGGWDRLEKSWDELEAVAKKLAAEQGIEIWREDRRIWGLRDGEAYLLASAADPDSDPMNLWADAFSRIDCFLRIQRIS